VRLSLEGLGHGVAAQVKNWKQRLIAAHHILVIRAETRRAFNSGFDTGKLHRPTMMMGSLEIWMVHPGRGPYLALYQGLTRVHSSAQLKRLLCVRRCS